MSQGTRLTSPEIDIGLERLYQEAFSVNGAGFVADEVVVTAVMHQSRSRRTEEALVDGTPCVQDFSVTFSNAEIIHWISELQRRSYVLGKGTWTSCVVHLRKSGDKTLTVFDEELIRPDEPDRINDRPADGMT